MGREDLYMESDGSWRLSAEEQSMPARRQITSQARIRPAPPETDIEFGEQRCSNDDRIRYLAHLELMHSQGRMTTEVFEARKEALDRAVVITDLLMLTEDLPPLEMTKEQAAAQAAKEAEEKARTSSWKYRWEHSHTLRFRMLAGGITLGAFITITGAAFGINLHAPEWVKAFIVAPSIVTGVAVAVWSVVMLTTDPYHGKHYDPDKPFERRWKA